MRGKKKVINGVTIATALVAILAGTLIPCFQRTVYAQDTTVGIEGKLYTLEEKSKYAYSVTSPTSISNTGSQFGTFTINGDIKGISSVGGFTSYQVNDGVVKLSYKTDGTVVSAGESAWHVIEDKTNEVNGEKLEQKIMKGTVILQSSNNGVNWITDEVRTNVAGDGTSYNANFYDTKEIQQINGCYYRVIVAYELEKRLSDTVGAWGITKKNYIKKKCVEVYEFYIKDDTDAKIAAGAHPDTVKVVCDGRLDVMNTGKDNGYSGSNKPTKNDSHFGWGIGDFSLRGFTNTANYQGEDYYLKNYGDAITLEFNLLQDINKLNGNDKLFVTEDENGWDQGFRVNQTNFKHGALMIRHTDFQGKTKDQIYTDYLAAYARTGADTRVQFFEEGDYEVALDYEIKNSEGLGSVNNYRLYFTFKIRNGNNMVYAFDNGTKSQLTDGAITANGFTIDTANSHYLTVTVDKYVLVDGRGGKSRDQSWSKTATDGNSYTDTGIYEVTVSNKYQPNGDVTKTFYVGTDPFLKALSTTGKSIDELNNKLAEGYTIAANGTLNPPPTPTPTPTPTPEPEEEPEQTEDEAKEELIVEPIATATLTPTKALTETSTEGAVNDKVKEENTEPEEKKSNPATIIVVLAVAASAGGVFYMKKKKENSSDNTKTDNTKIDDTRTEGIKAEDTKTGGDN